MPPRASHLPGAGGREAAGARSEAAGERRTRGREKGGKAERAREEESGRLDGGCYSDGKAAALAGSVPSPRILYERWRQLAAAPQTGRGAQGRRPGQPIPPPHTAPNRTPGPKRSRPGGARRGPPPPPPAPARSILARQRRGGFPRSGSARPCGAGIGGIGGSRLGAWGWGGRSGREGFGAGGRLRRGARARSCAAAGMRGAGDEGRNRGDGGGTAPPPPERGTAGRSPARSLMASR